MFPADSPHHLHFDAVMARQAAYRTEAAVDKQVQSLLPPLSTRLLLMLATWAVPVLLFLARHARSWRLLA